MSLLQNELSFSNNTPQISANTISLSLDSNTNTKRIAFLKLPSIYTPPSDSTEFGIDVVNNQNTTDQAVIRLVGEQNNHIGFYDSSGINTSLQYNSGIITLSVPQGDLNIESLDGNITLDSTNIIFTSDSQSFSFPNNQPTTLSEYAYYSPLSTHLEWRPPDYIVLSKTTSQTVSSNNTTITWDDIRSFSGLTVISNSIFLNENRVYYIFVSITGSGIANTAQHRLLDANNDTIFLRPTIFLTGNNSSNSVLTPTNSTSFILDTTGLSANERTVKVVCISRPETYLVQPTVSVFGAYEIS